MQNNYFKTLFFFLLFFGFNGYAQNPPQCERAVNFAELDINNVRARFWASGDMWFDPIENSSNYEVPKGSGNHSMFAFDFWLGAVDEMGRKRIVFQTHGGAADSDVRYFPGTLDEMGHAYSETCEHYDRVWKINKSTLDSFRLGLLAEIPNDFLEWPAKNNPHIDFSPNRELAPFIDVNNDNRYNPLDGDFPKILGDQALWWVFNDKGHSGIPLINRTVGIEGTAMAYAYNSMPELQNHTFYKYTFTNKSTLRMDSMMIGMFTDFDLGQFDDDLVGCDTLRNMGIVYNGDAQDGDYGEDVPMAGIKLLKGPQKDDGAFADMYTCWYRSSSFSSWGFPESSFHAYHGLWGLSKGGEQMTYGGRGYGGDTPTTLYTFPSDPMNENGWSMCSENFTPSDKHIVMSTGPFTLQPNEQKELHFAALWVRDNIEHPCPSFAPIQEAADYVQDFFDNEIITNIEENPTSINSKSNIHLFPNPATSNTLLYLEQKQALQKGILQLFDSLGRLVESVTLKEKRQNELQLSELQSGVYFYQIEWGNGKMENGKLMVL